MSVFYSGILKLFPAVVDIYLVLLFLMVPVNFFIFIFYSFIFFSKKQCKRYQQRLMIVMELFYGFFNPFIYLILLQRQMGLCEFISFSVLAVFVLVGYWSVRLLVPFSDGKKVSSFFRFFIFLGVFTVLLFGVKDLVSMRSYERMGALILFPYYVIPVIILGYQYRRMSSDFVTGNEDHYLMVNRSHRNLVFVFGILFFLLVAPFYQRFNDDQIKDLIVRYKQVIIESGKKYNIDPRLIASIIYINHAYYISPVRSKLESEFMERRGKRDGFDFSVGVCQIKPSTALDALRIYYYNMHRDIQWRFKNVREIPCVYQQMIGESLLSKELLMPERNIEFCAYVLSLYAFQWESFGYSIRKRPDVLASLYQIGFKRSFPKPDPKANGFGKRVGMVVGSDWLEFLLCLSEVGLNEKVF